MSTEDTYVKIKSLDNEVIHILNSLKLEVNNEKQIISTALVYKVFEGCRASIFLIQNNFVLEANYILKEVTEALIILKNISDNPIDTISKLNDNFNRRFQTTKDSELIEVEKRA